MVKPDRKFPPHPSGRPKPKGNYRSAGYIRPPREEPLTPGLRRKPLQGPIGFHASGWRDDPDYE